MINNTNEHHTGSSNTPRPKSAIKTVTDFATASLTGLAILTAPSITEGQESLGKNEDIATLMQDAANDLKDATLSAQIEESLRDTAFSRNSVNQDHLAELLNQRSIDCIISLDETQIAKLTPEEFRETLVDQLNSIKDSDLVIAAKPLITQLKEDTSDEFTAVLEQIRNSHEGGFISILPGKDGEPATIANFFCDIHATASPQRRGGQQRGGGSGNRNMSSMGHSVGRNMSAQNMPRQMNHRNMGRNMMSHNIAGRNMYRGHQQMMARPQRYNSMDGNMMRYPNMRAQQMMGGSRRIVTNNSNVVVQGGGFFGGFLNQGVINRGYYPQQAQQPVYYAIPGEQIYRQAAPQTQCNSCQLVGQSANHQYGAPVYGQQRSYPLQAQYGQQMMPMPYTQQTQYNGQQMMSMPYAQQAQFGGQQGGGYGYSQVSGRTYSPEMMQRYERYGFDINNDIGYGPRRMLVPGQPIKNILRAAAPGDGELVRRGLDTGQWAVISYLGAPRFNSSSVTNVTNNRSPRPMNRGGSMGYNNRGQNMNYNNRGSNMRPRGMRTNW